MSLPSASAKEHLRWSSGGRWAILRMKGRSLGRQTQRVGRGGRSGGRIAASRRRGARPQIGAARLPGGRIAKTSAQIAGLPRGVDPAGALDASRSHGRAMRQDAALAFGAQQHFVAHIAQRPGADNPAAPRAPAPGAASASRTTTATNDLVAPRRIRMTPALYHAGRPLSSGSMRFQKTATTDSLYSSLSRLTGDSRRLV